MLARPGEAFDSPDYGFEVKWDGTRILAFIDASGYRLLNRRRADATGRYPEFAFLKDLAPGTVLDGEVVVLRQGKPDFSLLMTREHARSRLKVRNLAISLPATYIVFDVIYTAYRSCMDKPLFERRAMLSQILKTCNSPCLVLCDAIDGAGVAFFDEVRKLGLEGMIAKRRDSKYLPGQRTDAWIKVKKGETVSCAIVGYEPDGADDFRSLILAAERDGSLHYVGKVGSGIDATVRKKLNSLMRARPRAKPFVLCKTKGKWIEPGLFCMVHCLEWARGTLRMPVFKELIEDDRHAASGHADR
jgi:bifunctional non-homologous end joining protein LigD